MADIIALAKDYGVSAGVGLQRKTGDDLIGRAVIAERSIVPIS